MATIEIAPGKFRPERNASIKLAQRQRLFTHFHVADAALQPGPVVARVQVERLIELRNRRAVLAVESESGGAPVMIAGSRRGHGKRLDARRGALGLVAKLLQIISPVLPQRGRRTQTTNSVGALNEPERCPQCVPAVSAHKTGLQGIESMPVRP